MASLWRQDRLRGLELATLAAAAAESPPSEATMKKLTTFARYGARIDKDIGRALYALRTLRDRPDDKIAELQNDTHEPGRREPHQPSCTNELDERTREPGPAKANAPIGTAEPEPLPATEASCTLEPEPRLNRHQRRALAAMARRRAA